MGDHRWAVSTANFAELYYRLAKHVTTAEAVPPDHLSAGFIDQIAVSASTTPAAAGAALQSAGDQMLQGDRLPQRLLSNSASSSTPHPATRRA